MIEELKYQVLLASIYIPVFWVIVFLFSNLKKNPARLYLLGLFINIALVYFMTFLRYNCHFYAYSLMFPLQAAAVLLSFPFMYLYIYSITNVNKKFTKSHMLHFILPILFSTFFFILFYIFLDEKGRIEFISKYVYEPNSAILVYKIGYLFYRGGKIIYVLQSLFYLFLFYKIYQAHRKNVNERFSSTEGFDLSWLKSIGILLVAVVIFNGLMHLLKLKIISTYDLLPTISYSFFNFFFMAVGILALKQKEIYNQVADKYEFEDEDINKNFQLNLKDFKAYIENEKPYLNKDITIYDLCFQFNTNRTYISSFINKNYNINFRTFINKYRIQDAKKMIDSISLNNQTISLEIIALKVGFNSYSTFLRVFKQMENITPIAYKENIISQSLTKKS